MKKLVLTLIMVAFAAQGAMAQPPDYTWLRTVSMDRFVMDGVVYAKGTSADGQSEYNAKIAAKLDASRSLLSYLVKDYFRSETSSRFGSLYEDSIRTTLSGHLLGEEYVDFQYHANGSATIWARYRLSDVLDKVGETKIKEMAEKQNPAPAPAPAPAPKPVVPAAPPAPVGDCLIVQITKGLYDGRFFSEIRAEDDSVILNSSMVDPRILVRHGVVLPLKSVAIARQRLKGDPWNRSLPLVVNGYIKGPRPSNVIYVSNSDAELIRQANEEKGFITKGAVAVIPKTD